MNHGLEKYQLSVRQACRALGFQRSSYRYQGKPKDDEPIREALQQLTRRSPRRGFKKIYQYLRNQGKPWNHKKVHRIYREMGLNLRVKPKKRLPRRKPQPLEAPETANVSWSLCRGPLQN